MCRKTVTMASGLASYNSQRRLFTKTGKGQSFLNLGVKVAVEWSGRRWSHRMHPSIFRRRARERTNLACHYHWPPPLPCLFQVMRGLPTNNTCRCIVPGASVSTLDPVVWKIHERCTLKGANIFQTSSDHDTRVLRNTDTICVSISIAYVASGGRPSRTILKPTESPSRRCPTFRNEAMANAVT